jgi:hypothetical protein
MFLDISKHKTLGDEDIVRLLDIVDRCLKSDKSRMILKFGQFFRIEISNIWFLDKVYSANQIGEIVSPLFYEVTRIAIRSPHKLRDIITIYKNGLFIGDSVALLPVLI